MAENDAIRRVAYKVYGEMVDRRLSVTDGLERALRLMMDSTAEELLACDCERCKLSDARKAEICAEILRRLEAKNGGE